MQANMNHKDQSVPKVSKGSGIPAARMLLAQNQEHRSVRLKYIFGGIILLAIASLLGGAYAAPQGPGPVPGSANMKNFATDPTQWNPLGFAVAAGKDAAGSIKG